MIIIRRNKKFHGLIVVYSGKLMSMSLSRVFFFNAFSCYVIWILVLLYFAGCFVLICFFSFAIYVLLSVCLYTICLFVLNTICGCKTKWWWIFSGVAGAGVVDSSCFRIMYGMQQCLCVCFIIICLLFLYLIVIKCPHSAFKIINTFCFVSSLSSFDYVFNRIGQTLCSVPFVIWSCKYLPLLFVVC